MPCVDVRKGGEKSCLLLMLLIGLLMPSLVQAQAPARSGQPYAEATLCARPDVIFCEDFNYPANFSVSGSTVTWQNPGLTTKSFGYLGGVAGRRINPVTQYPAQPAGSPAGGSVWVANWDSTKGATGDGNTWGVLRQPGGNYANGSAPAKDVYIRFQYYVTGNYAWPGDPKRDNYNYGSSTFPIDNKILFIYPPEGVSNPTGAAYDAGFFTNASAYDPISGSRFADALVVRVGDTSDNYKFFPLNANASYNPQHMEYGPFQSLTLRDPNDTPRLGKIFRLNTNRWYTFELRYKLSSSRGVNDGAIEVWVDGTKVYSAFDLETCGSGVGDCSGLGAIYVGAYHNGSDGTDWNGQQVIDNLVIAKSYVGPPGGGGGSTPPPPTTATLTVTKAGTGGGTVTSSPTGVSCGTDCSQSYSLNTSVSLTAAPATGSTFAGWSGACTGTGACTVSMAQARTVTATFNTTATTPPPSTTATLTVTRSGAGMGTITSNVGGINCGSTCSATYALNTSVTLTASAAGGSTFTGWSGACTGTGTCTVSMSQARSVTASFSLQAALLSVTKAGTGTGTVTSTPAGISCGTDCAEGYLANTVVTLRAAPATGSAFAGWSGPCTGTGTCTVTMSQWRTVTGTFNTGTTTPPPSTTATLTVTRAGAGMGTVTSSPSGVSCGTDCTHSYSLNTSVTLTASAAGGSRFTGWSGACSGTGTCTVSMSQARSVTASFSLQAALLSVTKAGTGTGTVTSTPAGISCGTDCAEGYLANTVVTLRAAAATGSAFAGWSGPCTGTGTCTVTMSQWRTVTGTFNRR